MVPAAGLSPTSPVIEHVHAASQQLDLAPLVKAMVDGMEQQAKVVRKAMERMEERSAALDERTAAQGEIIQKALDKLGEPKPEAPKRKAISRIRHDYDTGDTIVETEE